MVFTLLLVLFIHLTTKHSNRIFATLALKNKMFAFYSRKGPAAPVDFWHKADGVSWSYHWAIPARTVAQGAWEPVQPIPSWQVHSGQPTKITCPLKLQVKNVLKIRVCLFFVDCLQLHFFHSFLMLELWHFELKNNSAAAYVELLQPRWAVWGLQNSLQMKKLQGCQKEGVSSFCTAITA